MDPVAIALTTIGWLISTLINKAVTALLEEWVKHVGLGKEFVTLKKELTIINCTLETARRLQTKNSALLSLLKDLQQLAYEADDLLDELDYYRIQDDIELGGSNSRSQMTGSIGSSTTSSSGFKLASRRIVSVIRNRNRNKNKNSQTVQDAVEQICTNLPDRISMSRRMNELVEKLHENNSSVREALKLETIVTIRENLENQDIITNRPETSSHTIEKVFGRGKEQGELIDMIVGEEATGQTLSIVAIVGHGGVGKTTLARSVYNDKVRVKSDHFEKKMWVTVSNNFNVKKLTREILQCATSSDYKNTDNFNELQTDLVKSLKEKRFLLVLDDLWEDKDTNGWELLLVPLKECSTKGNVVIVTTRLPGIRNLDSKIKSVGLDGLEEDAYWSLFKAHAFGNEMHEKDPNLQNIGRVIVRKLKGRKLKGNPLAAKTVGALLKKDLRERHWRTVSEREEWKHDDGVNSIMPALRISYDYLSFHLQRCFSYCALFPKDFIFQQEFIVNHWIAQSFIHDHDNDQRKRLEDVGKKYLDDLVDFGFLQRNDEEGREYVMHDLLHDLAQNVSSEECASDLDGQEIQEIPHTTRHLSISGISEKNLIKVENHLKVGKLRTLVISIDGFIIKRIEGFPGRLKDAHGLRVLLSYDISITITLLRIPLNFTHLRYLALSSDSTTLPGEICHLYHLKVLDVRRCHNLKHLPNKFSNLINLRHFIVRKRKRSFHSMIASVGKLANIQELYQFKVRAEREYSIEQLRQLKQLREELCIYNLENVKSMEEAKGAGLFEKPFLNSLYLSWNRENPKVVHAADVDVLDGLHPHPNLAELKITGYGGASSVAWLNSLTNLEEVCLEDCVAWEILPPLGQLPSLKRLYLINMPAVKEIGPDFYGTCSQHIPFQCLEVMALNDLPNLAKWVWNDQFQNLPALLKLSITECPQLDFSLSPLYLNEKVNVHLGNVEHFVYLYLSESKLNIYNTKNPEAWDVVSFQKLRTRQITSLYMDSNLYPLSWDDLLSLVYLKDWRISDCFVSFLLPNHRTYNQSHPPLMSLKALHLVKCAITGKQLTWILHHVPMLSELSVFDCYKIKSNINEPTFTAFQVLEPEEDENLLQIPTLLKSLNNLYVCHCRDIVLASEQGFSELVSLQRLHIVNCRRLLFPLELEQPVSNTYLLPRGLQELTLEEIPDLTTLSLEGLSSLTDLYLSSIHELEFLDFTSCVKLNRLRLLHCKGLASLKGLNSLAHLKHFSVRDSPKLKTLLIQGGVLSFQTELRLEQMHGLESLDLSSCVALEDLILGDFPRLTSLKGLKSLARLKRMTVVGLPSFADAWISASEEGSFRTLYLSIDTFSFLAKPICRQVTSLKNLIIKDKDAVSMTEEQEEALLLLTSLKVIQFDKCRNLQVLPEKLHQLHTLKELIILFCINIQSLPENGLPKSLRSLKVFGCGPEVKKLFTEYECSPEVEKYVQD